MASTSTHRGVTNMPALRAGLFRGYLDSENREWFWFNFLLMASGRDSTQLFRISYFIGAVYHAALLFHS